MPVIIDESRIKIVFDLIIKAYQIVLVNLRYIFMSGCLIKTGT